MSHIPPRTLVCANYRHDRTCLNKRVYTVEAEIRPDGLWRYPTGLCCPYCGIEMWIQNELEDVEAGLDDLANGRVLTDAQWAEMRDALPITPIEPDVMEKSL